MGTNRSAPPRNQVCEVKFEVDLTVQRVFDCSDVLASDGLLHFALHYMLSVVKGASGVIAETEIERRILSLKIKLAQRSDKGIHHVMTLVRALED